MDMYSSDVLYQVPDTNIYTLIQFACARVCMHAWIHVSYMHVRICTYVCVHAWMCVCVYA